MLWHGESVGTCEGIGTLDLCCYTWRPTRSSAFVIPGMTVPARHLIRGGDGGLCLMLLGLTSVSVLACR